MTNEQIQQWARETSIYLDGENTAHNDAIAAASELGVDSLTATIDEAMKDQT